MRARKNKQAAQIQLKQLAEKARKLQAKVNRTEEALREDLEAARFIHNGDLDSALITPRYERSLETLPSVGPGTVHLEGNQVIGEILPNTTLTITDGSVRAYKVGDGATIATEKNMVLNDLDVTLDHINGIATINAAGNVTLCRYMHDPVNINADGNVRAINFGGSSNVNSNNGCIAVGDTGKCSELFAQNSIYTKCANSFSTLVTGLGEIKAKAVNDNAGLFAEGAITLFGNTGSSSTLSSNTDSITIKGGISASAAVQANKDICVEKNIRANAAVESLNGSISVKRKVDDGAALNALNNICVKRGVGALAALESTNGAVDVDCGVESKSAIRALNASSLSGGLAEGVDVEITAGTLEIKGYVGAQSRLNATTSINIHGIVRSQADVNCPGGTIEITGQAFNSAELNADTVIINGVEQQLTTKQEAIKSNTSWFGGLFGSSTSQPTHHDQNDQKTSFNI